MYHIWLAQEKIQKLEVQFLLNAYCFCIIKQKNPSIHYKSGTACIKTYDTDPESLKENVSIVLIYCSFTASQRAFPWLEHGAMCGKYWFWMISLLMIDGLKFEDIGSVQDPKQTDIELNDEGLD